ncbi:MAG: acetoin utilization protein [Hyphomicrobiales bacterium]|nr:acetoin utilization protein [Hyphomicrobiales bacterium]
MNTLVLTHPDCLAHDNGPGHPERADRVRVVERILEHERFQTLLRESAPIGTREAILRAHPETYYRAIEEASPHQGITRLDGDTSMSPGTFQAALRSVGGACHAVDEVMTGRVTNAFVVTRPPGHHAEHATAMGFCFFNNAAIAARHAQAVYGAERVAIMDFDVHHGNGTQDIFWADKSVLYASTHEMPLYPGTGALSETGAYGTIVNAPLRAGDDGVAFREAMSTRILPAMEAFSPDLVIISAGFDAHRRDPLANLNLVEADFGWATGKLMEVAGRCANGRVVSVLEGGYDLEALARSAAAHVMMLMGSA